MKDEKSVLFVLFVLVSVTSFSQIRGWNVKVGMNVSNWTTDELDTKIGYRVGVGTEYAFNDTWSLQPSLLFSTKGTKIGANLAGFGFDFKVNQMYLELPIMAAARFKVGKSTNFVVNAGPYVAYGVGGKTKFSAHYKGEQASIKFNSFGNIDKVTVEAGGESFDVTVDELADNTDDDLGDLKGLRRFDLGVGVGVALELNKIVLGLDGEFGLTKLETDGGKNLNFAVSVGYKF